MTRQAWFNQMDGLSHAYDVVSFDNRGVRESSVPEQTWTLEQMADDAAGLATVLGWDRFHLCGVSMGGMMAQEVALRGGERLRSLTLISTTHGGPDAVEIPEETLRAFAIALEDIEPIIRLNFGQRFAAEHPDWAELTVAMARANPQPPPGGVHQGLAV